MKLHFLVFLCLCLALPAFSNIADFNHDKKVDLKDFAVFTRAWNSHDSDTNYNDICDMGFPANQYIDMNDLSVFIENWCARTITINIFSNGWGHYCDTVLLEDEGICSIEFSDPEPPYMDNPTHYAYAYADHYYTELYSLYSTQIPNPPFPPVSEYRYIATPNIDLDPIDPNRFNGTIFLTQTFFKDAYLSNAEVKVYTMTHEPELILTFITDSQGRFAIDLTPGDYLIRFYEYPEDPATFHQHEFYVSGYYQDFFFPAVYQAFKPNIYLYPEVTTELSVQVVFPNGGQVTESEPLYGNQWQVTVETSGLIDNEYGYLFYESIQPDFGQYDAGWVVPQTGLEAFFRDNLAATGFNSREIDDYIDYWIPLLNGSPYYAIYPQYNDQLEEMIQLGFSVQPENLIRLIYSIRGIQNDFLILNEPAIPAFCRDGFTVVEWGVILK